MLELWLIRHGQTEWNACGRVTGWSDVSLTDLGRQQARALRQRLRGQTFTGIWSSDLCRARDTAELATGQIARPDPRLRELNFGSLDGEPWEGLDPGHRESILAFDGFCAPQGESVAEFRARVLNFLRELPPGRHLLFVHALIIRLILREVGTDHYLPPTSLVGLDWTGRRLLFIDSPEQRVH